MTAINDPIKPPSQVLCDFSWNTSFKIKPFTVDGQTFPYAHQEDNGVRTSDSRYTVENTASNAVITFDAIDSGKEGKRHVITPTDVFIVQYLWDFGDGTSETGPVASHEYLVPNPNVAVNLIVTDSRGLRWSCLHPLELISANVGRIVPNHLIA